MYVCIYMCVYIHIQYVCGDVYTCIYSIYFVICIILCIYTVFIHMLHFIFNWYSTLVNLVVLQCLTNKVTDTIVIFYGNASLTEWRV